MQQFHEVRPIGRDAAIEAFATGDAETICHALVAVAFHESDWQWSQERCLELLENEDPNVSSLAAACLGHVARIHKALDKERVVSALRNRMSDDRISGSIEDALDDIEMFV